MPCFERHCQESQQLFGDSFEAVHCWLDEFAGKPPYGFRHRRVRHHEAGIRQAMELFGPEAGPVARQHIIADLKQEGWAEKVHFPQDEQDYVRMGLF
ncbi:MAG: hypothetical protein WC869_02125 [Phycisphaerae bacterium]|jgi:hypothetical protein